MAMFCARWLNIKPVINSAASSACHSCLTVARALHGIWAIGKAVLAADVSRRLIAEHLKHQLAAHFSQSGHASSQIIDPLS